MGELLGGGGKGGGIVAKWSSAKRFLREKT